MRARLVAAGVGLILGATVASGPSAAGPKCMRYTVRAGVERCLWLRDAPGGTRLACKEDASVVHGPGGADVDGWAKLYRGPAADEDIVWVNSIHLVDARPVDHC